MASILEDLPVSENIRSVKIDANLSRSKRSTKVGLEVAPGILSWNTAFRLNCIKSNLSPPYFTPCHSPFKRSQILNWLHVMPERSFLTAEPVPILHRENSAIHSFILKTIVSYRRTESRPESVDRFLICQRAIFRTMFVRVFGIESGRRQAIPNREIPEQAQPSSIRFCLDIAQKVCPYFPADDRLKM